MRENVFRRVAKRFERGEWAMGMFRSIQPAHNEYGYETVEDESGWGYHYKEIVTVLPETASYCAVGGLRQEVWGNYAVPVIFRHPLQSLWTSWWAMKNYSTWPSILVVNDNYWSNPREAAAAFNQMADDWDRQWWRVIFQTRRFLEWALTPVVPVRDDLPIIDPGWRGWVTVPAEWVEDAVCESIVDDIYANA